MIRAIQILSLGQAGDSSLNCLTRRKLLVAGARRRDELIFIFSSDHILQNRPAMNYDKLSRSLRYYYEKGIMSKGWYRPHESVNNLFDFQSLASVMSTSLYAIHAHSSHWPDLGVIIRRQLCTITRRQRQHYIRACIMGTFNR